MRRARTTAVLEETGKDNVRPTPLPSEALLNKNSAGADV